MSDLLLAAVLPFILWGGSLGFFYLGRVLVALVFSKMKKDR